MNKNELANETLIQLQELLKGIRDAEIRLAEMQQEYIKFITQNVMTYGN